MGATLLQEGQPVAFASRALTETETRYAQIEKELLAVVFGLEKFHQMTYGRPVHVQSDHKPLETILKKELHKAPIRLQRMMLRINKYNIDLKYYPGRKMYIADTLSRAFLRTEKSEQAFSDFENVNMVNHVPVSADRMKEIKKETEKDETLQILAKTIKEGWPNKYSTVEKSIRKYFHIRDELVVESGLIYKGTRVIIPETLREDMKQRIHSSHLGQQACLRRARECIYWPNMNNDIIVFVAKCSVCRKYDFKQGKETLKPHKIPERPWEKVGVDLFSLNDKNYLITVDYLSGFFEIDYLPDTKSITVVNKLKHQFARYGIPDVCFSDNGPQFTGEPFKTFTESWAFEHKTSSPSYAQSNGKVENAVKSAKRLMKKAKESKSDPYLALLDYRNTTTQGMSSSPAQRLLNRRTKTLLPTNNRLLKPKCVNLKQAREELKNNKSHQETYYNKTSKDLPPLKVGDVVRIQPKETFGGKSVWEKGIVKSKQGLRSYEVDTRYGTFRRNRKHLRKTRENPDLGNYDMEFDDINDNPEVRTDPETVKSTGPVITRSGREVHRPAYLRDYE